MPRGFSSRAVSKVIDHIGLVAPFTVSVRLLWKGIWRFTRQHWDDEFQQAEVQLFLVWSAVLKTSKSLEIILLETLII